MVPGFTPVLGLLHLLLQPWGHKAFLLLLSSLSGSQQFILVLHSVWFKIYRVVLLIWFDVTGILTDLSSLISHLFPISFWVLVMMLCLWRHHSSPLLDNSYLSSTVKSCLLNNHPDSPSLPWESCSFFHCSLGYHLPHFHIALSCPPPHEQRKNCEGMDHDFHFFYHCSNHFWHNAWYVKDGQNIFEWINKWYTMSEF